MSIDKVFNIRRLVDFLAYATADEIHNSEDFPEVGSLLDEYADLLEAQEKAEPAAVVDGGDDGKFAELTPDFGEGLSIGTKLYTHPPTTPTGVAKAEPVYQRYFNGSWKDIEKREFDRFYGKMFDPNNGVRTLYTHPEPPTTPTGVTQVPVVDEQQDANPAPANSLPDWSECSMRVGNSEYIAKRKAEGGYDADYDSKLANHLHYFIYEYDDSDPYKSAWFMHRLELAINEAKQQGFDEARAKLGQTADKACSSVVPDDYFKGVVKEAIEILTSHLKGNVTNDGEVLIELYGLFNNERIAAMLKGEK